MPDEPAGPASYTDVYAAIERVIVWYRAQAIDEQQAAVPDQTRIAQLVDDIAACLRDQHALEDAEPDELARIGAAYDARLRDLSGP